MRTDFYPSIDRVLKMFKGADQELLQNRSIRPLLETLHKVAYFSPRISGHILTRRTAIQSYDWHIKDDDTERATTLQVKLNKFINQIIYHYLDAVNFGVFNLSYNYQIDESNFNIPVITEYIPPMNLDYQDETIYKYDTSTKKYLELNPENNISYIYNPYTRGGILRSVLIAEILRHSTTMEWANLNKLLKGIITSVINPELLTQAQALMRLSDDDITTNLTNIDAVAKNAQEWNYLRTLNFAEIKAQSVADAQAGASYKLFVEALNNDIAIAFLGQANTTELPESGGSRAALNVLNLIRADILYSDLLNLKIIINKFLLQFYKLNYNPNVLVAPIEFEFVFDEAVDIEANARTFEYVSRIGNIPVSTEELYTKLGLQRPDNTPDIITLGEKLL